MADLEVIEGYLDAVPRPGIRVEDFGPLTLFVQEGEGWPYYARPTRDWAGPAATAADVDRVRARQRELGIPESFEWVAENTPTMRAAVEASGLVVEENPLLVLDEHEPVRVPDPPPGRWTVRMIGPDDPVLPAALAVSHLAFAEPGTLVGATGSEAVADTVRAGAADGSTRHVIGRMRAGLTMTAAAVDRDGEVLCVGQHQPVGPVTEIVGVGTLPAARRRGLGLAVTAALVVDARARGVRTVFLSAGSSDVARIYARLGFRRIGMALAAEPSRPPGSPAS
jgi:ribosomal protein S18 acetylase RimI-like enzyme